MLIGDVVFRTTRDKESGMSIAVRGRLARITIYHSSVTRRRFLICQKANDNTCSTYIKSARIIALTDSNNIFYSIQRIFWKHPDRNRIRREEETRDVLIQCDACCIDRYTFSPASIPVGGTYMYLLPHIK